MGEQPTQTGILEAVWRSVRRVFTERERKLALQRIVHRSSLCKFSLVDVEYLPSSLDLPRTILGWRGEFRMRSVDDCHNGYYLAALAEIEGFQGTTAHVASFFNLDGSVRSGFKTPARRNWNGSFFPQGPREILWSQATGGSHDFLRLVDSILNSIDPRQKNVDR